MAQTQDQRSAEEIEQDIRETQAEMSRTARQIEGELTPRNVMDALLDKAGDNGVDGRYLLDAARRNPLALGMIAIGGLWLVSDADARPSAMKLPMSRNGGNGAGAETGGDHWHPEHRSYVEHMARCEPQPGEDEQSYRRRRDHSRASYFMLEQGHDEDESAFRRRLDEATEGLRQRRERMSEGARAFAGRSREHTRQAMDDARGFYFDNPLLGGLAAAFVGAVAGSALPATRTEEDYVGGLGEQALDAAGSRARDVGEKARHRKDEMLDEADNRLGVGETDGEGGSDRPPRFGEQA
jgi:ElaB/YqjD/DUF883 family membrane-anchored ribosome-binding protein